jgi:hypothetical protein
VILAAAILLAKAGDLVLADSVKGVILRVVRGGKLGAPAPDKEDEREAVELAGTIGLREGIPDLERRAWGLGSLVRDTCAWHAKIALARMGHARASSEILNDLDSPRAETRAAAVVAAGKAKVEAAAQKLESMRGGSGKRAGDEGVDPQLILDALARLHG